MIKNSTYIRHFTLAERNQLIAIQQEYKINTIAKVLLFTLGQFQENKNEIARLKRITEYKQRKIERLEN